MAYPSNILEEELKNRVREDYFSKYDAAPILGDVDFAVAIPATGPQLFETEYLLWAEAKKGTSHNIYHSIVQLILTIGKARTFDKFMPPKYLGAFDAEKIAFIPYNSVIDVFSQNDFNWNVKPSDHSSKEFLQLSSLVEETSNRQLLLFKYDTDDKELRKFIKNFFKYDPSSTKIRISKSNFIHIYQKWLAEVKPSININWDLARNSGIYPGDFYLADILSKDNSTLRDKLNVLLRTDHYVLDRKINDLGLTNQIIAHFSDDGKAHTLLWNRYSRPPKREYWDEIIKRQDLLVPDDVRERKGSFFTPKRWVELSQQYLADELGENWQEEYMVWDCCAGTGNLLAGLSNKFNIWASTIDKRDVDAMHDRIKRMNEESPNGDGSNLLDSHVFQFDFLNDPFSKLPKGLQNVLNDPERRRKLVIYINPPYAEASNARTSSGTGENRPGVSDSATRAKYKSQLGKAANELFAQFYARIVSEIPTCELAVFSTLKTLQAPNFTEFRQKFPAKLGRIFLVPANTFDNVKGDFPIGFQIWHTAIKEEFRKIEADIFDAKGGFFGHKSLIPYSTDIVINRWLNKNYDKEGKQIGWLRFVPNDFQNNRGVYISSEAKDSDIRESRVTEISINNFNIISIYLAVRLCIEATWLNDRDQFLYPNDGWKDDDLFKNDCLVFTLFHGQNRISNQHGTNHWIPFTESEVNARDNFASHFMTDYISGRNRPKKEKQQGELFETSASNEKGNKPLEFSPEATAVMDAGRELWRYYHSQPNANPNASFYDIRLHFQGTKATTKGKVQMNSDSNDVTYTALIKTLRERMAALAKRIEPKVYEYGFLKGTINDYNLKKTNSYEELEN